MSAPAATVAIEMPQMGESVTEGTVISWLKEVGDRVEEGEPLVEISTDKVDAEVPAPASGTLVSIAVGPDETVPVGTVLGEIATDGGAAPAASDEGAGDDVTGAASYTATGGGAAGATSGEAGRDGETIDVELPQMGESVQEGTVVEWLVSVGDKVSKGQPLVEISTDKVDAEVPAPADGTVTEILVESDETVPVGTVLCRLATGAPTAAVEPRDAGGEGRSAAAEPSSAGGREAGSAAEPEGGSGLGNGAAATPVARRAAQAHGVDLARVSGSGPRGRITKEDVLRAASGQGTAGSDGAAADGARDARGAGVAAAGAPSAAKTQAVREVPLRGPAATLARYMERSRSIPTATSFRTIEVDELDPSLQRPVDKSLQRRPWVADRELEAAAVPAPVEWRPLSRIGGRQPEGDAVALAHRGELAGRALGDDTAGDDHRYAVGELLGFVEVVGGQEDCGPELAQTAHKLPRLAASGGVEAGGRFVEKQKLRSADESDGEIEPSTLAARQRPDTAFGELGDAAPLEQLLGIGRIGVVATEHRHGLERRQERVERRLLRDDPDPRPPGATGVLRVLAEHGDFAAVASTVALEDLDSRRLARAVGAEEGEHLAAPDLEIDAAQRLHGAVSAF